MPEMRRYVNPDGHGHEGKCMPYELDLIKPNILGSNYILFFFSLLMTYLFVFFFQPVLDHKINKPESNANLYLEFLFLVILCASWCSLSAWFLSASVFFGILVCCLTLWQAPGQKHLQCWKDLFGLHCLSFREVELEQKLRSTNWSRSHGGIVLIGQLNLLLKITGTHSQ